MYEDPTVFRWGVASLGVVGLLLTVALGCWLCEKHMPQMLLAKYRAQSPMAKLVAAVALVLATWFGGAKPSGGGSSAPGAGDPPMLQMSGFHGGTVLLSQGSEDQPSVVTNRMSVVRFGVDKDAHKLNFALSWTDGFWEVLNGNRTIDIFMSTNLLDRSWTLIHNRSMPSYTNACDFSVGRYDVDYDFWDWFEGAFADRAFFRFGTRFDTDGDGLTDAEEEFVYGTSPVWADTDFDGLTDYDECRYYATDPRNPDSDGDGVWDGDERDQGSDPLLADSDADGLADAEEARYCHSYGLPLWLEGDGQTEVLNAPSVIVQDQVWNLTLSNAVSLAGRAYSNLVVDVNGVLYLSQSPVGVTPNNHPQYMWNTGWNCGEIAIAPFWSDLVLRPSQDASVSLKTNANGDSIVEFLNAGFNDPNYADRTVSFQVVLSPSATNRVIVAYKGMERTVMDYVSPTPRCGFRVDNGLFADGRCEQLYVESGDSYHILRFGYGTDCYDSDSDGDLLSDYDELFVYHTDPTRWTDSDNDDLSDGEEMFVYRTDPNLADSDGDGVEDGREVWDGFDPLVDESELDTDGDDVLDFDEEYAYYTNRFEPDTDGDGLDDFEEIFVYFCDPRSKQTDWDDLPDYDEVMFYGTDPANVDTDGDGLADDWEIRCGLNPLSDAGLDGADGDCDVDGIPNWREQELDTDPKSNDTDGDGLLDGDECETFLTDPCEPDTDGDDLWDGDELDVGTSPLSQDTDGDGLPDGWELRYGLDPLSGAGDNGGGGDPDGDGLDNAGEFANATAANVSDTDGDGLNDLQEAGGFVGSSPVPWFDMPAAADITSCFSNPDRSLVNLPLPNFVSYGGIAVSNVVLDVNGVVYLRSSGDASGLSPSYYESMLTRSTLDAQSIVIAPYWYDLIAVPDTPPTRISAARMEYGGSSYYVIEYANIRANAWSSSELHNVSFQLAIPEGAADCVYVRYTGVSDSYMDGRHAQVGFQGWNGRPRKAYCNYESGKVVSGQALTFVIGTGTNPNAADADNDRLTDPEEVALGTDPFQPDTDGDGLNDGWENENGFDPTVNNDLDDDPDNDRDEDPDGDGLTNGQECDWNTDPFATDTDNDGVDDGDEVGQFSDPDDATDGGRPASRVPVTFTFGDQSESHSEKYRIELTPVAPRNRTVAPAEMPKSVSWVDAEYGECETKTAMLARGFDYELRMFHAGTNEEDGPDYDYSLMVSCPPSVGIVTNDPSGLIKVDDRTSTTFSGEGKVATITVLEAGIYADYDRDGKIDESDRAKLYAGRKLRHWVNDDDDDGDVAPNSESDIPGAQSGIGEIDGRDPDWDNSVVDGRCDLVDFAPVRLDISGMLSQSEGSPSDYSFRLSQADGAVKVVWTSEDADLANTFLTTDLSDCGVSLRQDSQSATALLVDSEGLSLPSDFLNLVRSNPDKGVMLIEGCAETTSPLVFECRRASDDELVFKVEMPLSISGVEKMYRTCSLRGATDAPGLSLSVPAAPENAAEGEKDLDVFFLHGFNVNAECARAWGSEIFKRLWQSGSNARFHILPWHGDYSWSPGSVFNGLHYQHNVWFAQRTAGALKRYIGAAQSDSSKRILMTHSLGNMVACEALREGLEVGKYFMFDAALPSEAIDGTLRAESSDDDAYAKYVRPEWRDHTNLCWASNWHRLFSDSPNDARGTMSWANRFQDALANAEEVFNYYSSGDSVFTEQDGIPSLGSDVHVNWGLNWFLWIIPYPTVEATFENHCWQKQEVLKGMATLAGTLSGGWGFNVWQEYDTLSQEWKSVSYSPAGAAAAIADGSITNRPAFDVSDAVELMNPNATEDDVFLALAKHVPALSHPVGGTNVIADCISENVNMSLSDAEGGVSRPNGWGRMHPNYGVSWLHSDMKDMAFFYVYQLYNQLITKGNLR